MVATWSAPGQDHTEERSGLSMSSPATAAIPGNQDGVTTGDSDDGDSTSGPKCRAVGEKFLRSIDTDHVIVPAPKSKQEERDIEDLEVMQPVHSADVPEGTAATATARVRFHSSSSRSRRSRLATVVPASRRRGLFAPLAFMVPEVERPYDYDYGTKWAITAIVALAGSAAPLGSSIFYPALPQMAIDLKASTTTTNLTVALYMLSMSIFPLWWSSFSETLGRRTIYVLSFSLFVVFSAVSAISTNVAMLIVMRVLGGGASASVQAVGAGTIADIFEVRERGRAMGIFYLGPLAGPLLAPIIGGALSQKWGWQSTMWFLTVYGGLILLMIVFCLPETLARKQQSVAAAIEASPSGQDNDAMGESSTPAVLSRMSTRQSISVHTKKMTQLLKRFFVDPLDVLLYLRFLPIAVTVFYAAITFGALFIMNISLQSTFSQEPYGFSELIIGLLYVPPSLGYFFASLLGGRWIDKIMAREARKAERYDETGRLVYLPEDRMRENAWLSAVLYPAAQIVLGWTLENGVHWAAPAVASFVFGFGSMLVFGAATTMLTEFMPSRSSGGIAVNNFVRNIFSSVGVIVAQPLINAIGVGWLSTAAGLITFSLGITSVWSLRRFGPRWRREMDEKMKVEAVRGLG